MSNSEHFTVKVSPNPLIVKLDNIPSPLSHLLEMDYHLQSYVIMTIEYFLLVKLSDKK